MIGFLLRRPIRWFWLLVSMPVWLTRLALGPRRYDVVHLTLSSPVPELGRATGLERFFRKPRFGLWELYELVRAVTRDRRVRAVHLEIEGAFTDGLGTAQAIAEILSELRRAGIRLLVQAPHLDNRLLWIAAGADGIALPPSSVVYVPGHSVEIPFLGDLLDSLGLKAEIVKSGDYKTAGDSLTRSDISPAHREMLEALLADLQEQFLARIAEGRRLAPEKAAEAVERGFFSAEAAREAGLVDRVLYPDQVEDWIGEAIGGSPRPVDGWRYLGHRRLLASLRRSLLGPRRRLAVVAIEGVIVHEPPTRYPAREWVSASMLADPLATVRKARWIEAALLRINSPGGSASESELIWRDVQRLAEEKPVVASMGDVAASGGYYIAAPASRIVALPGTLTGSIGVLSGKLDASGALERFGVRVVQIGKSPGATLFSPASPLSPEQRRIVEEEVRRFYDLFLERVASGRGLETAEVHQVGQGRVWTGRQALERRLADANGGILEALRMAKEAASIPSEEPIEILFFRPTAPIGLVRFFSRRSNRAAGLARLLALLSGPGPLAWWSEEIRVV